MNITEVSITAVYLHKEHEHFIVNVRLENDPSRIEIVLYRSGNNIIPVLFSQEDCPVHRYWNRDEGSPESFIRDMAEQVAVILNI